MSISVSWVDWSSLTWDIVDWGVLFWVCDFWEPFWSHQSTISSFNSIYLSMQKVTLIYTAALNCSSVPDITNLRISKLDWPR